MTLYDIQIRVEELKDGGDYRFLATSPDLPSLIVAGDTEDEVLALAPQVASALVASIKAAGDTLPETLRAITSSPSVAHITIAV